MGAKEKEVRAARSKSAVTFETCMAGSLYILSSAGYTHLAQGKMVCQGYMADGTVDVVGDGDDDSEFVCVVHRSHLQYRSTHGALHDKKCIQNT
jgi:hypothetical protein